MQNNKDAPKRISIPVNGAALIINEEGMPSLIYNPDKSRHKDSNLNSSELFMGALFNRANQDPDWPVEQVEWFLEYLKKVNKEAFEKSISEPLPLGWDE